MPCTYDTPEQLAYDEARESRKQVNELTKLLCSACQGLENTGSNMLHPGGELGAWWVAHKKRDVKRVAAEQKARKQLIKDRKRELARLQKEIKELEND